LGLLDGQGEGRVAGWVTATVTGRDRDRTRQFRKQLSPFCVGSTLLVLDRRPFRMSGHTAEKHTGIAVPHLKSCSGASKNGPGCIEIRAPARISMHPASPLGVK